MAKGGGTKEDMLNQHTMLELELHGATASIESAATKLSFDGVLGEIHNKAAELNKAAEDVARARARGYVWAGDLEQKLAQAQGMAAQAQATARAESTKAARDLRGRVDQALARARRAQGRPVQSISGEIQGLVSEAASLSSAVGSAESRVRESVKGFTQLADELAANTARVHFTLDCFEKASFRMQPEENPVLAVKATWEDSPQGRREGALLFTAHRVRFEHHEEVVLERSFLFFATRTDTKRALMLDALIGQLAASDESERGLVFKDQLLTLGFAQGHSLPQRATFEIDGATAKEVDTILERLRSGDMARARYQGAMPAQSNVGVPVKWPTKCENCGAELTPPVRGQNIIACDYCGSKHPVELGQA